VRDVAARLRVSTARVYALIESGELTHLRLGNNTIRVSEADLAAYLARGQR
jgi:excisionase family DNA binding protein